MLVVKLRYMYISTEKVNQLTENPVICEFTRFRWSQTIRYKAEWLSFDGKLRILMRQSRRNELNSAIV